MIKSLVNVLLVLLVVAFGAARAQDDLAPDALVKKLTDDVLAAITSDKDLQAGDKKKALALAEEKVLPYIDFRRMTALAVGKSWRGASTEQREALVAGFRSLLVRTYSNAIGVYRGQRMVVDPVNLSADATDTTVHNRFLSPGREAVAVDYRMHKTSAGWRAYDIVVEGVSLVTTYRGTFDQEIHRRGVDGLIKLLQEKNAAAK
jgi:phospholipid transport system substrate-binding protein